MDREYKEGWNAIYFNIMVSSKITNFMEKEKLSTITEVYMKENFKMVISMEKVNLELLIIKYIMETLKIICFMDTGHINGKIIKQFMKVNIFKVKSMDLEKLKLENLFMKVDGWWEKWMEMGVLAVRKKWHLENGSVENYVFDFNYYDC